jgi:aminoglycoside 2'-N-acetyltransferase I
VELVRTGTDGLTEHAERSLRRLFAAAWPDLRDAFGEDDWEHAVGGTHFLVLAGGEPVAHASVVERRLEAGGVGLRTGYVEAVATAPALRRRGLGTRVMRAAGEHIDAEFELGALGTDVFAFYEPLGWRRWKGPTAVRRGDMLERTPDEDGLVMVRLTPHTPAIDLDGTLACDWRRGDVW